ncbi:NepR family anti-sigma factor [Roseibium sp. M-1]
MASKAYPDRPDTDFGLIKPSAGAKTKEDWIGSQLKKVYDDALSENIPDDMLDLLSALDQDTDRDSSDEEAAE